MTRKYSIFGQREYLINLSLPIFIILASFVEFSIALSISLKTEVLLQFLMDLVFLNAVHILFTFLCIFGLKEFQKFIEDYQNLIARNLYREWLLVFIFLFFVFWYFFPGYPVSGDLGHFHIINMAIFFFAVQHAAGHSVGLSSLSLNFRKKHLPSAQLERATKYNRSILLVVVGFFLIFYIAFIFLKISLSSNQKTLLTCVLIFYIFCHYFFIYKQLSYDFFLDSVFGLRHILYLMSFFSISANFGRAVIHGHESLMVYKKIVPNSGKTLKVVAKLYPLIFFLLMIGVVSILANGRSGILALYLDGIHPKNLIYQFLFSFFYALTFLHFYIENQIYRFKDPLVLKNHGHLFFN